MYVEVKFMKHEKQSLNTKKLLAKHLKKIMRKKPLSKITISDIIKASGVNRKTFYYHFESVPHLFKWLLEQEVFIVLKNFDMKLEYKEAVNFVIQYVSENQLILNASLDAVGRDGLSKVLGNDFHKITLTIIEEIEHNLDAPITQEFKGFLAVVYSELLAGMIINWLKNRDNLDKNKASDYISLILNNSLPNIIKNAADARY
jgi:AcrR family transcriptional regulator